MRKQAVVIVSGGLDSTVLYYYIKHKHPDTLLIPVHFHYGSRHGERERQAARYIFDGHVREIDLDLFYLESSLLGNGPIPQGHYQHESMISTVVPFRNGIMLAHAVAIAESDGADDVYFGAHGGDHAIYPDCRQRFVEAFRFAAEAGTYGHIQVLAPFTSMSKAQIVTIAKELKILDAVSCTWSCYVGGHLHCGRCGTCVERKEAFELAGVPDPTQYEEEP